MISLNMSIAAFGLSIAFLLTCFIYSTHSACADWFRPSVGRYTPGGNQVDNIDKVEDCQAWCALQPFTNCAAIDYNNQDQCYFHTSDSNFEANSQNDGGSSVTQYARVVACNGCQDEYTQHKNTYSTGGYRQEEIDNLNTCKWQCMRNDNCFGLDFTYDGRCYFFPNTGFSTNAKTSSSYKMDQYRKIPNLCSGETSSCVNGFTPVVGYSSSGGMQQSTQVNTSPLCRDACNALSTCLAVDFNTKSKLCFVHVSANYVDNSYPSADVTQYRKGCDGGCIDTFDKVEGTSSSGGAQQDTAINTAEKCTDACLAQTADSCLGVDFATTSNLCYFHTKEDFETKATPNSAVNQYRRRSCRACADAYDRVNNTHSQGGQEQASSVNSMAACKALCNSDPDCKAFDFSQNKKCYLHFSSSFSTTRSPATGVTQWVKLPCGPCTDTFDMFSNTYSLNGAQQTSSYNTLKKCKNRCLEYLYCYAVDFDTSTKRCYLHRDSTAFLQTKNIRYFNTRNQYRRKSCLGDCVDTFQRVVNTQSFGGSDLDASVDTLQKCELACLKIWDTTAKCYGLDWRHTDKKCFLHLNENYIETASSTTQLNQYRRQKCVVPCNDEFHKFTNTHSSGGIEQSGITTEAACKARCNSIDVCYALDFNVAGKRCWIHQSPYFKGRANTYYGINQYRKEKCNAPKCVISYTKSGNKFAHSGKKHDDARTVEECKAVCSDVTSCVGVDFSRTKMECFLHNSTYTLYDSDSVDNYLKLPCDDQGCSPHFARVNNTLLYGGEEMKDIKKASDCQVYCLSRTWCLAFDFNRYLKACSVHRNVAGFIDTNILNVDHYRKITCNAISTGSPRTPTTPVCMDRFSGIANRHAYGGEPNLVANTETKCKQACLDSSQCVAVDFEVTRSICFLHKNIENLRKDNFQSVSNTNHFRRLPCWATTTVSTLPGSCVDFFKKEVNTLYINGYEIEDVQERMVCDAKCLRDNSCVGYDWDRSLLICFLHYSAENFDLNKGGEKKTSSFVDHYRRADCTKESPPTTAPSVGSKVEKCFLTTLLVIFTISIFIKEST